MSDDRKVLQSIAEKKARLAEELRQLECQEEELRLQQATTAFEEVVDRLNAFAAQFTPRQRAEISALIGEEKRTAKPSPRNGARREVVPKYWLPHSGETWSGRGRPPRAFAAWVGTAAYKEWKRNHPDEKFPAFPG